MTSIYIGLKNRTRRDSWKFSLQNDTTSLGTLVCGTDEWRVPKAEQQDSRGQSDEKRGHAELLGLFMGQGRGWSEYPPGLEDWRLQTGLRQLHVKFGSVFPPIFGQSFLHINIQMYIEGRGDLITVHPEDRKDYQPVVRC